MKLILDNVVYDTENKAKIERLKELGAVELVVDEEVKDYTVKELKELLDEKGIEYSKNDKKDDLIKKLGD